MPRLASFYGIQIRMQPREHGVPHFHASYEGRVVSVGIRPIIVLSGSIRSRALGMVLEWASLHQDELESAWNIIMTGGEPSQIEPLN
jgi:hypothetical protein